MGRLMARRLFRGPKRMVMGPHMRQPATETGMVMVTTHDAMLGEKKESMVGATAVDHPTTVPKETPKILAGRKECLMK